MAVQQGKTTSSRRGMRRAHDALTKTNVAKDKQSGELHFRHHISPNGFYKNKKIVSFKQKKDAISTDSSST
ncbi:MAG: 50S ribosomal protein L32 [Methylacidiphilales bacterium]|nr:50S ribosomal protein L32 [Candidatus Methylacidiphilales bacterium]